MMSAILGSRALHAVGWALLHFVWQGTVLILVAALLLRAGARLRAAHRYLFAAGMLALAPVSFVVTLAEQLRLSGESRQAASVLPPSLPASRPDFSSPSGLSLADDHPVSLDQATAAAPVVLIALIWIGMVTLLTIRLGWSWRTAGRLARVISSQTIAPEAFRAVHAAFIRAARRMGFRRSIRLAYTDGGFTPVVVGSLRAVVLLPVSIVSGLTVDQVELLLAHEIAHLRRYDFLVNLLQSWVELLFFFHPGVSWLSRRLRLERELACDEAVVSAYQRPADYGQALAALALLPPSTTGLTIAASASPLALRLRRLFHGHDPRDVTPNRWLLAMATPGVILAALAGGELASLQVAIGKPLDRPLPERILSRHQHLNREWGRSVSVISAGAGGDLLVDLQLGRSHGVHFLGRLRPAAGRDTSIVSLTAERDGRQTATSDSLLLLFIRESGINARSRATGIVARLGPDALLQEVTAIGNPMARAAYLHAGVVAARSAVDRERLLREALRIGNSSVAVSSVLLAAMTAADTPEERDKLVARVPEIEGEAERLMLLLDVIGLNGRGTPSFRSAILRATASLPGGDARDAVRAALAGSR